MWGDSNCDGEVDFADVVLIMQSLANPNKYGISGTDKSHITEQGIANGDVYDNGSKLTTNDAQTLQKYLLHVITELPEKK